MNWIKEILNKPSIIGIIANINEGKSNLLYNIVDNIRDKSKVYTFGLRCEIKGTYIFNSIEELENINNSVIIIDEFRTLFDLDNRHKVRQIEEILRYIHHNNNILIIVGLPENYKKFIGAKINTFIYKKCSFGDFIRGSNAKKIIDNFKDTTNLKGTTQLNLNKDEALIYNNFYKVVKINYLEKYDTKKNNEKIIKW